MLLPTQVTSASAAHPPGEDNADDVHTVVDMQMK